VEEGGPGSEDCPQPKVVIRWQGEGAPTATFRPSGRAGRQLTELTMITDIPLVHQCHSLDCHPVYQYREDLRKRI
jgi:hypothetical protein